MVRGVGDDGDVEGERSAAQSRSVTGATYGIGFVVADGRRSFGRVLTNDNQPAAPVRSVERREEDDEEKDGENEEYYMLCWFR